MRLCLVLGLLVFSTAAGFVPEKLLELFSNNLTSQTKEGIITGDMSILSLEDLYKLPVSLIHLLPMTLMKTMTGSSLGLLLQLHHKDVAVAVKMIEVLDRPEEQLRFLDTLVGVELPIETQSFLGNAFSLWWPEIISSWGEHEGQIKQGIRIGTPLLSYLPADMIREFHGKDAERLLFYLRTRNRSSLRPWSVNSKLVQRVWAELVFREIYSRWAPTEVKGFEFLVIGATASEIYKLSKHHLQLLRKDLFSNFSTYNKLQSRALFSVLYSSITLTTANLTEMLPIVMQLSPRDLQHFSINDTDFKLKDISSYMKNSSFATDKQIGQILEAQAYLKKNLSREDSIPLEDVLQELGQFAYTMPVHMLNFQPSSSAKEWSKVLTSIDSHKLSRKQAWFITMNGTFLNLTSASSIYGFHGLLKAIPLWKLVKYQRGELPHDVLLYLASSLPRSDPALSVDLLYKLKPQLDDKHMLESLLNNEDSSQFFDLLSSQEIKVHINQVFTNLNSLWETMQTKIEQLPRPFLSSVLHLTQTTQGRWMASELTQHIAFMGLSCNVTENINPINAIDVLSQYNSRLQSVGRRFPKDLQPCCLQLLYKYLKEKAYIQQTDSSQLLNLLEPSEIQAIGGYILASIHPEVIEQVWNRREILYVIGRLPLPQLWEATGQKTFLDGFAEIALKSMVDVNTSYSVKLSELLQLGSLVHFLRAEFIKHILPADFRFFLEAQEYPHSKTLCATQINRKAWFHLIIQAFGPPSNWSETAVSTLGDWLVAVPENMLDLVPNQLWMSVVDHLVEKTAYHRELSWPGQVKPVMFYKVCMDVLSPNESTSYNIAVQRLMNRLLVATQTHLDTVWSAQQLLLGIQDSTNVVTMSGVKLTKIANEIEVIQPIKNSGKKNKTTSVGKNMATTLSLGEGSATTLNPPATDSTSAVVTPVTLLIKMEENNDFVQSQSVYQQEKMVSKRSLFFQGFGAVMQPTNISNGSNVQRTLREVKPNAKSRLQKIQNDNRTQRKISCDGIRALGQVASLALHKTNIDFMSTAEVLDCLEVFGTLKLPHAMYMQIWQRIKASNKTALMSNLIHLGRVVQAIEQEDVKHLDLDLSHPYTLDVVSTLGRQVRYSSILQALGYRFMKSNRGVSEFGPASLLQALGYRFMTSNRGVSELGPASLVALGRVLCDLPILTIRKLVGPLFVAVATSLADVLTVQKVVECPVNCLDQLATLAMEDRAFGSPNMWTADDLTSLGVLAAGLSARNWQLVPAPAMHGLSPSAVKCISPQILKELSMEQLVSLTPLAAAMMSEEQLSKLSPEQSLTILTVKRFHPIVWVDIQQETTLASGASAVFMNASRGDGKLFLKYLRIDILIISYTLFVVFFIIHLQ